MSRSIEGKIKLNSFADIVGGKKDTVVDIPLEDLHEFRNHPYKVLDDEKMEEMVNSIRENGILVPGVVRPLIEGGYEIISGHRRKRACEILGLETMPAIIRNLSDDDAVIAMVNSNIYREDILPSEKARAYCMRYEAEKHQGKETDGSGKTLEILASDSGESSKTIQRYIWLSRLSEELLNMVDKKRLSFVCGVDISFLKDKEQRWVYEIIKELSADHAVKISPEQSGKLKNYSMKNELTRALIMEILSERKPKERKVSIKRDDLARFFDDDTTDDEIRKTIIMLLDKWQYEEGEN